MSAGAYGGDLKLLRTSDFNRDGISDIAIMDGQGAGVRTYLGNGDGTFRISSSFTMGNLGINLEVGDINGDGYDELSFINYDGGYIALNRGDGTFSTPTTFVGGSFLFDINGDNILDTIRQNSFDRVMYLGNADSSGKRKTVIDFLDLITIPSARKALDTIDRQMQNLNSQRAGIGASLSRFSALSRSLTTRVDQYSAAESRIVDVDVAQEAANLVRSNILQQVGASVLAQANLQPEIALKLLAI